MCLISLLKRILWLTRSKVLQKSTNTVRTKSPESDDDIQVCSMAVSACTVDRRLRQPNWQLSREGSKTDKFAKADIKQRVEWHLW